MTRADSPSTSSSLLRLLRSRVVDEAAWQQFLGRYRPLIQHWCRQARLQPADVDEVESRVLASLVSALRGFAYDPAKSFRGWLRTVVQNTVHNYWRERAHEPGVPGPGDPEAHLEQLAVPDPLQQLAEELDDSLRADLRLVQRILHEVEQQVAPHTWQAYWLTAIEGQAPADVARKLGIPVAHVYVAKNRVARKLRAAGQRLHDSS